MSEDKLKSWLDEIEIDALAYAQENLNSPEFEEANELILILIKIIRKQQEALERMDSKNRDEERKYLEDRIEVRLAVVEAYRNEARTTMQEVEEMIYSHKD